MIRCQRLSSTIAVVLITSLAVISWLVAVRPPGSVIKTIIKRQHQTRLLPTVHSHKIDHKIMGVAIMTFKRTIIDDSISELAGIMDAEMGIGDYQC